MSGMVRCDVTKRTKKRSVRMRQRVTESVGVREREREKE